MILNSILIEHGCPYWYNWTMKRAAIYLITDDAETPRYVGKSADPRQRCQRHLLRHAWAHAYRVLEWVADSDRWQDREKFWIRYYRRFSKLENVTEGGGSCVEHSPETLQKMRYTKSPEQRAQISATIRRRWREGVFKRPSGETIQKMRAAKQRNRHLYVGNNWGSLGKGTSGHKYSNQSRRKMAEAAFVGRWLISRNGEPLGSFESAIAASKTLRIPATTLRWIKNECKGFRRGGKYAGLCVQVEPAQ